MIKVIIKHLAGSKANQTETFESPINDLLFGRDASSQVTFDPEKDDLVSRLHCKITVQNGDQFYLTDLNSRNGTLVNGQKIISPIQIYAGDTVQLGKDGPRFVFDLDPRPKSAPKATRFGDAPLDVPMTREIPLDAKAKPSTSKTTEPLPTSMTPTGQTKPGVGRNTVERLITQVESNTRKKMINIGAGIIGIVVLVSGFFIFQNYQNKLELEGRLDEKERTHREEFAALKENMQQSAADIFKKYGNTTVMILASWKLIYIPEGRELFQQYLTICESYNKKGKCIKESIPMPGYVYCKGVVEPYLETNPNGISIGSSGQGTGFVVKPNGYIITNRHVAAGWNSLFSQTREFPLPGIIYVCSDEECTDGKLAPFPDAPSSYLDSLNNWIPSKTKCKGKKPLKGKVVEGRNDYLDVIFPKTQLRIPAGQPVRVSDTADLSLIKINTPEELEYVETDSESSISTGEAITVMGYPGSSPDAQVKMSSYDPLNREGELSVIPNPTVTPGSIGKIIKGNADVISDEIAGYFSGMGDVYQLTVNATGSGNSGGPVFNGKGKVIAVFTYRNNDATGITFAVPIRHSEDIMGVKKVIE